MKHKLVEKYPFTKGKIDTITNGFDPEDFKNLTAKKDKEKFVIAYTGSLYGLRTGEKFFTALKKLIKENPELQTKMQVLFAGLSSKQAVFLIEKFGLKNVIKLLGYRSHQESLTLMAKADVLLLIMSSDEVRDAKIGTLTIPGKLFEYLGAKRPILAIAPPGPAADIISSTKTGVIVPPRDTGVIAQAIFKLFQEWESGSYTYVDDMVEGIFLLMHSDLEGAANIGCPQYVSVDELVATVAEVAGKHIHIKHIKGPVGVQSRNFSNARIYSIGWKSRFDLKAGIERTYPWIEAQVKAARAEQVEG